MESLYHRLRDVYPHTSSNRRTFKLELILSRVTLLPRCFISCNQYRTKTILNIHEPDYGIEVRLPTPDHFAR